MNSIRLRERVAELQEAIRAAALASRALEVRVFGSVARGDEVEHSDIDFLVTPEPGRTLLDLARLEVRLEQLLGRRVDVVTIEGLREPMRSAALREAVRV